MKVMYTGGTGRMGVVIRESLAGRYDAVRLLSRSPVDSLHESESVIRGDLTDLAAVEAAAEDVDVIIHLGGISDEAPFEEILESNILGTYNVYEAARRQHVRRVVFASSNHAIGFYPTDVALTASMPVRPDTYYGTSKVFGEGLARLYYDKWGIESVCLRIGSFRQRPEDERQLSTWLSHRDGVELIRCSVETADVGFVVAFGVSANRRSWWKDDPGAASLGFRAVHDSEGFADSVRGRSVAVDVQPEALTRQGGPFTQADYRGGVG